MTGFNMINTAMVKNGQKECNITLEGNLTLQNIAEIKNNLLSRMNGHSAYTLSLVNVKDIDLSFLQVVLALDKYLEQRGKKFDVKFEIPDEMAKLLINAGFEDILKFNKN